MSKIHSDVILEKMMSLHPKIIDLTLDRVFHLLDRLGNPEKSLPPVIHIAGTNGKGSTLAMIRAGLESAGHWVHAYTSPHLVRFHERIMLAGNLISEPQLASVLGECHAANDGGQITYFEITTCAAMLAMSRVPAAYTLLETGLGGRLDATNVVEKPALSIITPISHDHEAFLGDTLEQIAAEKAGIIKPGVPCIVGPQPKQALRVIRKRARELNAPLILHGTHWRAGKDRGRVVYEHKFGKLSLPPPALAGAHQIDNLGMAVTALRHLEQNENAFEAAASKPVWPARLQRLSTGPLADSAPDAEIWLDGGHNPAAGMALSLHMESLPPREMHLICGMMNTKDAKRYFKPLARCASGLLAIPIPGEPNSLSAEDTAKAAESAGLSAATAESAMSALMQIVGDHPRSRIFICGSLYLAGTILRENG
ncbi:MAG: bifunctional folylpolyglutamate synthase/dihydrofolate synthase [Roseovarius sp.]|nr:bifunctional folylpolyglutamate synthase/dihydrofolate synthase [Roseovarius sp.]